jgi:hypothetical protein
MVRLVGQEVTGACKAKAQSGAFFRVESAVVPFCLDVRLDEKKEQIESIERRCRKDQRIERFLQGGAPWGNIP